MARGWKTLLTIDLTAEQRETLTAWQRSTTIPAGHAKRGRIILLIADRVPLVKIAPWSGSPAMVSISGHSAFCKMTWKVWQTNQGATAGPCRALAFVHQQMPCGDRIPPTKAPAPRPRALTPLPSPSIAFTARHVSRSLLPITLFSDFYENN